jgi:dipeptidyl aminopeptidase/acylaminoacyl peptidase
MTGDRLERLVTETLYRDAPVREPDSLVPSVLAVTRERPPRPGWMAAMRDAPMEFEGTPMFGSRVARLTYLLGAALLALVVMAGGVLAGGQLLGTGPMSRELPGNGVIAFGHDGDIWSVDAKGGEPEKVTSGPELDQDPAWSPDGTRLAYVIRRAESRPAALVVMDIGDGSTRVLAEGIDPRSRVAWSPDGGSLLFSELLEHTFIAVEIVSVDTGQLTRLAHQGEGPAWMPDARIVATDGATGVLWLLSTDGSEPVVISRRGGWDDPPRPSPDGSLIALAPMSDSGSDIWILRTDGAGEYPISEDPAPEGSPSWSPDGQRLAWLRTSGDSIARIVIADKDGSDPVTLEPLVSSDFAPVWSQDGAVILARAHGGPMLAVDPVGNVAPLQLAPGMSPESASWQPVTR